MGLRSAVAAATAISVSAAAASYTGHASSNLRVGVYVGGGISPASAGGYVTAMQALVQQGTIASAMNFSDPEVEALNAVGNPIDVLVVPGGYSPDEGTAMTPTGLNAIRTFVLSGGGYVSSCAGSYLAGTAQCCHDPEYLSYCSVTGVVNATQPGCYATPWSIGMINMATLNPWDRGHGPVNVSFSDEAIATLHLDPAVYSGKNASIIYWQGPIQDKSYPWTGFSTLATYTSEIHDLHPNVTTGVMINTPAIITTSYGHGRVLASSPHPEMTDPMPLDIIAGYVLWAGRVY